MVQGDLQIALPLLRGEALDLKCEVLEKEEKPIRLLGKKKKRDKLTIQGGGDSCVMTEEVSKGISFFGLWTPSRTTSRREFAAGRR